MLVYLSFLICTLSGVVCRVAVPVERPFIGVSACQIEGMTMVPSWEDGHAGWLVRRIRCSIGTRQPDEEVN
jgi:hypothetical protein